MSLSSGATSLGYSSSALRFGLMDIKPVEVKETFKRWGMKFRRIGIRYEPLRPTESYKDFVTLANSMILSRIPLPEKFDRTKLVRVLAEAAVKRYENDKEFQEALAELKEKGSRDSGKSLTSFVNFMKSRFERDLQDYFESEAESFMKSNFPLSFFSKLSLMDNTYLIFLVITERVVRRCEILATLPGTRKPADAFKQRIEEMKQVLSPLIDQMDECVDSYFAIKRYINIWNARDYDDALNPEFLDKEKVDPEVLAELQATYMSNLSNIRKLLFQMSRLYSPEAFETKIDFSDPTIRMLVKLLVTCSEE